MHEVTRFPTEGDEEPHARLALINLSYGWLQLLLRYLGEYVQVLDQVLVGLVAVPLALPSSPSARNIGSTQRSHVQLWSQI